MKKGFKSLATRVGLIAGLAALLLWPANAIWSGALRTVFGVALAITAGSGSALVTLAAADLLLVSRDARILPARLFDVALGALLALPSALALFTMI